MAGSVTSIRDGKGTPPRQYLTMRIGDQSFAIPVIRIQEVIGHQPVTRIPKAPRRIAGSLNLRGRVVTSIDVRVCLDQPPTEDLSKTMSVVVEYGGDIYSLVVDAVGEVILLDESTRQPNPTTLDPVTRGASKGIYRLDGNLLVELDIDTLLALPSVAA